MIAICRQRAVSIRALFEGVEESGVCSQKSSWVVVVSLGRGWRSTQAWSRKSMCVCSMCGRALVRASLTSLRLARRAQRAPSLSNFDPWESHEAVPRP